LVKAWVGTVSVVLLQVVELRLELLGLRERVHGMLRKTIKLFLLGLVFTVIIIGGSVLGLLSLFACFLLTDTLWLLFWGGFGDRLLLLCGLFGLGWCFLGFVFIG